MWSVEKAVPADASEILLVQKEAFRPNQAKYSVPLPPMQETLKELQDDMEQAEVLVARESDRVIGAVRFRRRGDAFEVYRLAVNPAYSHLDVGQSLMQAVENRVRQSGESQSVILETGLRDAPAIEFYLKMDYRPSELAIDQQTGLDVVRFTKSLG
ncbi:MAG: GNAT family N-acetyltransferase [Thermaerobacterales bacterium]